jgi:hypothetical protein
LTTVKARKVKPVQPAAETPIEWTRADPAALDQFDAATKTCTMNCGPHGLDPRSREERLFLCDDCDCHAAPVATVRVSAEELAELRRHAERYLWLRERSWYIDQAAHVFGMIEPRRPWGDRPPRPDWDEVEQTLDAVIIGRDEHQSEYE